MINIKPKVDISQYPISESSIANMLPAYCEDILDLKVTHGNNFIFSSNDLGLKYYNAKNKTTKIFDGHKDFILNIYYKNGFVVTSSKDGTLRVWKEIVEPIISEPCIH